MRRPAVSHLGMVRRVPVRRLPQPNYRLVLCPVDEEDGGGWLAIVPDLPGCVGTGRTRVGAVEDAELAIEEWLEEAARLDKDIPEP